MMENLFVVGLGCFFFNCWRTCGFVTVGYLEVGTVKIILVHKLHEGGSQR